jgi:hypothetical protein
MKWPIAAFIPSLVVGMQVILLPSSILDFHYVSGIELLSESSQDGNIHTDILVDHNVHDYVHYLTTLTPP